MIHPNTEPMPPLLEIRGLILVPFANPPNLDDGAFLARIIRQTNHSGLLITLELVAIIQGCSYNKVCRIYKGG